MEVRGNEQEKERRRIKRKIGGKVGTCHFWEKATLFPEMMYNGIIKVSGVKTEGRTEVKITEDDYIKQEGDWKRKLDKLFNGD